MRSTYSDPTASIAIARVDRELRMQRRREELQEKAALDMINKKLFEASELAQKAGIEKKTRFEEWLERVWPVS